MWQILVIVVCLVLNALIAASELAFVSLSKSRLRHLAEKGEAGAKRVLELKENPERILSILQLGQTFISIVAAAVGGIQVDSFATPLFTKYLGSGPILGEILSLVIFVFPYTLFSVVVSELLPKSLALRNPKWVIYKTDRWLVFFSKLFAPLVFLLEKSTRWCAKLFHPWVKDEAIEKGEWILTGQMMRPYVRRLVSFEEKPLVDLMIPWQEVGWIEKGMTIESVEKVVLTTGHTRLPVVEKGKPIALLHSKEFHLFLKNNDPNWQSIVHPLVCFDKECAIVEALRKLQKAHSHLGVVFSKDEPIGIVTMEDIFEEVVGEIYDEDDFRRRFEGSDR